MLTQRKLAGVGLVAALMIIAGSMAILLAQDVRPSTPPAADANSSVPADHDAAPDPHAQVKSTHSNV